MITWKTADNRVLKESIIFINYFFYLLENIPQMTRATTETKEKFIEFLEEHRAELKYARKGYLAKLLAEFEKETEQTLTMSQMKRLISLFRLTHNCPIEYVPNYHYKPGVRTGFHNYVPKEPVAKESDEPVPESPKPQE